MVRIGYKCRYCDDRFETKDLRYAHLASDHGKNGKSKSKLSKVALERRKQRFIRKLSHPELLTTSYEKAKRANLHLTDTYERIGA